MAKSARRRCKNEECREWFHPAFANQWWCSPECGTKIALERRSKEREKAEKAAEKKRRREEQKQKDKLKIRKLALKPRSYWIKQAQQAVTPSSEKETATYHVSRAERSRLLSGMPGITEQPLRHLSSDLMNAISISNASCAINTRAGTWFLIA